MTVNRQDVVVVGGGIGGLATAFALARTGRQVRVLEQAPAFGEVGAGLQMAPNATRILRDWGLLDAVVAAGVTPSRLVMRDAIDGEELTSLDLRDAERRYGAPYVVVHRSDLHSILEQACRSAGVDLRTNAPVESVVSDGLGAMAVAAGEKHEAEIVVAADGLSSTLRASIHQDVAVDSHYVAHRGTVAIADHPGLEQVDLDEVTVFVGPGRHFVQYALRGGTMLNTVAVHRAVEPGTGRAVGLDEAFAGSCARVEAGLTHLWRDRSWAMFDREPISDWVQGRMVLTGDAAHPMLQYLAQGACQALEDAAALAACHEQDHSTPENRLAAFAQVRAPRTAQVQQRARAWGELWHVEGDERAARNQLMKSRDVHDYTHVDWLYA